MAEKKPKKPLKVESLSYFPPFEELERLLSNEFLKQAVRTLPSSLLQTATLSGEKEVTCPVDIIDEEDHVLIMAEMPGIKREDLEMTVSGDMVRISGEKKHHEVIESKTYYRLERSYGSFSRSFRLPFGLEADKATARLENGVLEIRIPKTEEAKKKTKKIFIH
jgi:HSP20 family protein